jgi:hypothetical protein
VAGAALISVYVSEHPYGSAHIVYQDSWVPGVDTSYTLPDTLVNGGRYRWNMQAHNAIGSSPFSERLYFTVSNTARVTDREEPSGYILGPNRPNPFNGATVISFRLPRSGAVRLTVHNLSGQLVETLAAGRYQAGRHEVSWRPDHRLASGTYLCRLQAGSFSETRRMVLAR